ncbi:hypothetical protein AB0B45_31675 [Nonomuraea sp. NPDC049152]|uniref:hypothetical protein n=1 Tax=Nonomuraea sp. NPDC049152 TaxID=3154350 RepID=UPI0033D90559
MKGIRPVDPLREGCPVRIYPHMIFGNQVVGREYTSLGGTDISRLYEGVEGESP